ncbi:hypothetical protein EBO34_16695 [Alteribacter keqinensis]|uniref:Uncharacterized protein n=1 Tax=Alteribacter keqinensis TaxID=2483800 RepID=A0A3M7TMT2_9BACI|nr:hypothetical protein EBO34_16695 [Alteribacter keqinensis]
MEKRKWNLVQLVAIMYLILSGSITFWIGTSDSQLSEEIMYKYKTLWGIMAIFMLFALYMIYFAEFQKKLERSTLPFLFPVYLYYK